jgi:hypothetical protein
MKKILLALAIVGLLIGAEQRLTHPQALLRMNAPSVREKVDKKLSETPAPPDASKPLYVPVDPTRFTDEEYNKKLKEARAQREREEREKLEREKRALSERRGNGSLR